MKLRVWHTKRPLADIAKGEECRFFVPSGLEPTIKNFFNTSKSTLSLPGRNGNVVNFISVEVRDALDAGESFELLYRADSDDLSGVSSDSQSHYKA